MAFPADYLADLRAALINVLGADQCNKFAFADLLTDARRDKWFVRLERATFADRHRGNAPAVNLSVKADWVCELFRNQSPADAVSADSDSYADTISRAESAVLLLCAAQAGYGLSAVSMDVARYDNGHRAILRFSTNTEIEET